MKASEGRHSSTKPNPLHTTKTYPSLHAHQQLLQLFSMCVSITCSKHIEVELFELAMY